MYSLTSFKNVSTRNNLVWVARPSLVIGRIFECDKYIYCIDTIVLLENVPLVKLTKTLLWDQSGLFSIISHVTLSMT